MSASDEALDAADKEALDTCIAVAREALELLPPMDLKRAERLMLARYRVGVKAPATMTLGYEVLNLYFGIVSSAIELHRMKTQGGPCK